MIVIASGRRNTWPHGRTGQVQDQVQTRVRVQTRVLVLVLVLVQDGKLCPVSRY